MNDEVVISSPLMRLPEVQRNMYEHFFELIYQCSANRVAAKALVDRILLRLEQADSPDVASYISPSLPHGAAGVQSAASPCA
jgi:hypothetical protein